MKFSVIATHATMTLLAASFLGCGADKNLVGPKVDDKVDEPTSKPASAGQMSLTVAGGTLRDSMETLTVVVEDASGQKQEQVISGSKVSTFNFLKLSPGLAKVSAYLQGSATGDLEGSGEVEIVAGKKAKLALSLVPSQGGGLDIIIERPQDIPTPVQPIKPGPKSLLMLTQVPKDETFTFRSSDELSRIACNGFETFIAFESGRAFVAKSLCAGKNYSYSEVFGLSNPKAVAGLVDLLNGIERLRGAGDAITAIACLPKPGVETFKLTHVHSSEIAPSVYSNLGASGCEQHGDFAEKQARDVHTAILKFVAANADAPETMSSEGGMPRSPAR